MKLSKYISELQKLIVEHGDIEVLGTEDPGWPDENYHKLEVVEGGFGVAYFEDLERDIGKSFPKMARTNKLPETLAYTAAFII